MVTMNVIDSFKNSYEIVSEIGKGSQGSTYLLRGGKYIVKLFNNVTNPTELKSKVNFLKRLDLDKDGFAIPLEEITQPKIGYISEFASGMEPLTVLRWTDQTDNLQEWFIATGGLLKRLQVLTKLAERIRTIHSKGLIYCDLSPNNVFVSTEAKNSHVFLIDLDNLRYKTSIINNIFTPFYAAPELVKCISANSMESDCFSFAVIAYELLTLNHPLIGDYVNDGEPELEEKALAGEIPWVDHSTDFINARTSGIPSDFFITKSLKELFKHTFEDGLNYPNKRPTISEWCNALYEALNEIIKCPECNIHYPLENNEYCPFCKKCTDSAVKIQMKRWECLSHYDKNSNIIVKTFGLAPMVFEELLVDKHTTKYIKNSHFLLPGNPNQPVMQVKVLESEGDERLVEIIPKDITFYVAVDGDEVFYSNKPKKIRVTGKRHRELVIGITKLDTPQRVLTIE